MTNEEIFIQNAVEDSTYDGEPELYIWPIAIVVSLGTVLSVMLN